MKKIIIKTLGDPITVKEADLSDSKYSERGYFDPSKGLILIDKNLTEADKYATLIHEFMHLIDEIMVQNGAYKKRTPHASILNIADNLMVLLAVCGLLTTVTPKQAIDFIYEKR